MARRKPIPCPGCGAPTLKDLCRSCVSDIEMMKEKRAQVESGELMKIGFDTSLSCSEYYSDRSLKSTDSYVIEKQAAKRILAIIRPTISSGYFYASKVSIIASGAKGARDSGLIEIITDRVTAENVAGLMEDITNLVGINYREGYRAGSNLLARLRDGNITVDEFNDRLAKGTNYK